MDWKSFYNTYLRPKDKGEWIIAVLVGFGLVLMIAVTVIYFSGVSFKQ